MKTFLLALSLALAGATLTMAPFDADAQRLGRGKAAGMQRQVTPAKPADKQADAPAQQQPAQQNATAPTAGAAAAGAAANTGKRSWLGPIAGLAAGLGIAALLSHFGLGGAFANFMTMLLLAVVAFVVVRWLLRKFAGGSAGSPRMQYAGVPAGASAGGTAPYQSPMPSPQASAVPLQGAGTDAAPTGTVPAGFDAKEFERIAKMIFIRLQAANDAGEVDDLRKFTTPELFASLRLDLQERGGKPQQTDVVQLDAQLVDTAQENDQWIASVRFSGLIREQADSGAAPFDELWHLVKPVNGNREWAIAGITPVQ